MRPTDFTTLFARSHRAAHTTYLADRQTWLDDQLTTVYRASFPKRKIPKGESVEAYYTRGVCVY